MIDKKILNKTLEKTWKKIIGPRVVQGLRLIPVFDIWFLRRWASRKGRIIPKLEPISYEEYCKENGDKFTIIEEEQKRKVFEPEYYPHHNGRTHEFFSPYIYIAELSNVVVHGGTGIVISKGKALTDICKNDVDNRVYYACGSVVRGNKRAFYLESLERMDQIDTAVNLCGMAANNYYHLTVEILSRYSYVKKYLKNETVPVLLDESARRYPQYIELTKHILGNVDIIYVSEGQRIMCEKLIYPSMNTWMPMNVKKRSFYKMSDNLIAESAIKNIREATQKLVTKKTDRKLFISRKNADISRICNEKQLAKLFEAHGFEIVCTEELSFKEQVKLFSSASCIVGASGAALTNFIYCNKGTVVGCFIPRHYEFCIYSSIASMVGCVTLFFDAKVYKKTKYMATEKCIVDLKQCESYISELEGLIPR